MASLASSFSDISTQEDTPRKGKVTGIPGKIKDHCIDFHGLVQKWNNLTKEGYEKLKWICDYLLNEISNKEAVSSGTVVQTSSETENDDDNSFNKLQELTQDLRIDVEKMKVVVQEMKKIAQKLKSIAELTNFSAVREENGEKSHRVIYFQAWPVEQFYEVAEKITLAYTKELKMKCEIIKEIPRLNDKRRVMLVTLNWTHQIFITCETENALRSIIVETHSENK